MSWIPGRHEARRRRTRGSLPATIEVLESRALLADGITPAAGAPISAVAGVPITNAVFATFTVTDPSVNGAIWRSKISFGDGQVDKNVPAVPVGSGFEFVDTHTYQAPGTYTVTIMIAQPTSAKPNDNTVTTQVTVTTPPPAIGSFKASGLSIKAKVNKTFHGNVARFSDPNTKAAQFQALINWGDGSTSTTGQIHTQAKGRFLVVGSHRYAATGSFEITVTIQDAAGQLIAAESSVRLTKK